MGCLLGSADTEKNEEEKPEELSSNKERQPSYSVPEWSSSQSPMIGTPYNPANFSENRWPSCSIALQSQIRSPTSYAYTSSQAANLSFSNYPAKIDVKYQMNPSEFPALPTGGASNSWYESKNKVNKWTKYNSEYQPLDSDYSCFDTSSSSSTSSFAQYKPVNNLKAAATSKNNIPEKKPIFNQKPLQPQKSKPNSSLNGSTSDSSAPSKIYSEFIAFILSYSILNPKPESITIPNSFRDMASYINYFGNAFYVELNAILDQALEEAFLSNKYRLYLNMKEGLATLSPSSTDELKFENEIQTNDIVIIIPYQNNFPKNFDEIKENNISWILGLVDLNREKISILLNPDREGRFKNAKKYIVAVIGNITSLKRELSVLDKIKRSLLLDQILSPQICEPHLEFNSQLIEIIQNKYNQSQVEAIINSINSEGKISLIQGPPGTGKTRTVAGILSGLYAVNKNIKVLVCAQSNAAVDEIAWTILKEGIFDLNGDIRSNIKLLRIGEKRQKHELGVEEDIKTSKEIEIGINSIKLNVLVDEKLSKEDLYDPTFEVKKIIEKREELEKTYIELEEANNKTNKKSKPEINKFSYEFDELEAMYYGNKAKYGEQYMKAIETELRKLSFKLDDLKSKKAMYIDMKTKYNAEFIRDADILFCTLSGSGSIFVMQNINSVSYLIIDEACQSLELSSLIPFQYNPRSAILIGDPKQLPATTFADASKTNRYDRSLFERIMKCNVRPVILSIQYRMTKEISDFTSKTFYNNQIQCSESVIYRKTPNWVYPTGPVFFNIETSEEIRAQDSLSYYNEIEADFVLKLYALLKNRICNANAHIGIISPYKGQVQFIEELLYERYGHSWKKNCEVSSVDGFQGREVDLVILSTVRSECIGFLRDERRMNVAISRAKYGMYAVGNETCLSNNLKWRNLIEYCKESGKYESCSSFKDMNLLFNKQTYY